MRKVKEVLRLRFELGFGQRQIARSCRMGLSTVHEYLERAAAAGISWPLPEDWSEEELEGKLFGQQPIQSIPARQRPQPDWKTIHEQLITASPSDLAVGVGRIPASAPQTNSLPLQTSCIPVATEPRHYASTSPRVAASC